ncbi:hypothetical protein [Scytonema hofmannii]|nr:hypothetical protein [Scytonema hofmannii]
MYTTNEEGVLNKTYSDYSFPALKLPILVGWAMPTNSEWWALPTLLV